MTSKADQPPAQTMRWRLSSKIIMAIGGVLLVIALAVAGLTFIQVRRTAYADLEAKGQAIADTLNYTFEVLLGQQALANLQRLTENSATLPSVRKVLVAARDTSILASSTPAEINGAGSPQLSEYLAQAVWETKTYLTDRDELIIIKPLRGPQFAGGMNSNVNIIGAVEVTLDRRAAESVARSAALSLLGISLGGYVLLFVVLALALRAMVVRPVKQLAASAQRFRSGERSARSAIASGDEIGLLAVTFNAMADEVQGVLNSLETQVAARTDDLERQRATLARALEELQLSTADRLQLAESLRELSTPVINLYHQIIMLPLIGTIDASRAAQIQANLLRGISAHGARQVIIDLTGVPVIDDTVAAALTRMPRAARLLGAEVILVGISPEVAQSMVALGIDFTSVTTFATLQTGVQHALAHLGLSIAASGARRRG